MNKHELRALEAIERNRQLRKRNAELLAALQVAMNFLDTNDNDERQAYMDCRAAVRTATEGPADDGALPIPGPGAS